MTPLSTLRLDRLQIKVREEQLFICEARLSLGLLGRWLANWRARGHQEALTIFCTKCPTRERAVFSMAKGCSKPGAIGLAFGKGEQIRNLLLDGYSIEIEGGFELCQRWRADMAK